MRRATLAVLTPILILVVGGMAMAADTDSHQVQITITTVNELDVSTATVSLTPTPPAAGSQFFGDATDDTSTLAWTTNETSRKITVETNLATPSYTLTVEATAIAGGTSAGVVALSTTGANDIVTDISSTAGMCNLRYTASATIAAPVGTEVHTVTYTLTAA